MDKEKQKEYFKGVLFDSINDQELCVLTPDECNQLARLLGFFGE